MRPGRWAGPLVTPELKRWLRQADIDDGVVEGQTTTEQEGGRPRRQNRRLQQEVEVLRRATAYFAKDAAQK